LAAGLNSNAFPRKFRFNSDRHSEMKPAARANFFSLAQWVPGTRKPEPRPATSVATTSARYSNRNCLCAGRSSSKRRPQPLANPSRARRAPGSSSSPRGPSGFWRGRFRPARGSLTSLSPGAPRIQSFAHQLFDDFAPRRLRFWLRGDNRIQPSQQFWRHPHPYRRACRSGLFTSCSSSRAHNALQFGWSKDMIEDLDLHGKPRISLRTGSVYRKRPIMKYHCHFTRVEPKRGWMEFRLDHTMPPTRCARESKFGAPHRSSRRPLSDSPGDRGVHAFARLSNPDQPRRRR
jgi:hypothetical protein